MPFIVNLSSTHDFSIDGTVAAFTQLCNQRSRGCLRCLPGFFQHWTNYAWVVAQYKMNYTTLIEPYKLGKISTEQFLDNLSRIFYFMNGMDRNVRHKLLIDAWNASIKLSATTKNRLSNVIKLANGQPIYLISNTNELNVNAILALLQQGNPDLKFNENIDISIRNSNEPIEILPNVFLCLSYRYGAFKGEAATTVSLLEQLAKQCRGPITLVSQFSGDLDKGRQLGFDNVVAAEEFYQSAVSDSVMKKTQ